MSAARLLAVVLLLAAACGDAGVVDPGLATTQPPSPATTQPAATTTEPAATTTSLLSTTTSAPSPSTTMAVDDTGYVVAGVAADDVLNVREGPGVEHPIVAELAPDATGVLTTGFAAGDWWEVQIGEVIGWVNSTFLALPAPLAEPFASRPCNGEPSTELEGQLSDADHLLALDRVTGGDGCERFVFVLGEDAFGYGPLWPFNPTAVVPQGAEVETTTNRVTITLPAQVDLVRPTATEADYGETLVFVVGRADGGLDLQLHFADPVEARVFSVHDPARIMVDAIRSYSEDAGQTLPYVGGQTAVLPVDPLGEGVALPVTIRGYGRPFEAQGEIELLTFGGELGVGEPVEATWIGIPGEVTDVRTGYMTTDWTSTWGSFEVTLLDVSAGPGQYQLFVGETLPDDEGTRRGVYVPITVVGG